MNKKVKTLFVFLAVISSTPTFAQGPKVISDSLVENLSCHRISSDEIYRRIRPDSLSSSYHTLSVNWPFSAGLYNLGACWSLSRAQRLFFYLARWNESQNPDNRKMHEIFDMVRGSKPYANSKDWKIREADLTELSVFPQKDSRWTPTATVWSALQYGFTQRFANGKSLLRAWKTDIEHYQKERFHEFAKNLKFIIGDDARSDRKNRQTRDQLLRNLESNRLTLLVLRPTRMSQHVVVAKSFEIKSNGTIDIRVYDSNQPLRDQILTFDNRQNDFFAPTIVRGFAKVRNPQAAIGVFIVDEYERTLVDTALVKHYKRKCL